MLILKGMLLKYVDLKGTAASLYTTLFSKEVNISIN